MNILFATFSVFLASSHAQMTLTEYMNQPAKPLDAQITLSENATSETITKDGGQIELEGADGTIYTLTVPSGALDIDTEISMTEIQSFTQYQLKFDSSPAIGVQLQPEGLILLKPATLSITPKNPIDPSTITPITGESDGKDVQLADLSLAPTRPGIIDLTLLHFSPYVITGSMNIRESILNAFNNGRVARIQSWTADQIMRKKSGKDFDKDFFETATKDYFENAVKPLVNNIETCEGGRNAISTLLGWKRQNQLLGFDPDTIMNNNFESALFSKAASLCKKRLIDACYIDHRPFDVFAMALGFSRQKQLLGAENDPIANEMVEIARKCMNFDLEIKSTISTEDPGNISTTAETNVHIFLDPSLNMMSGGTVKVTAMTADIEGLDCKLQSLDATEQEIRSVTLGMNDLRFDQSLGVYVGALIPFSIGHFKCTDHSDPPNTFPLDLPLGASGPNDSYWGGLFLAMHSQPTKNEYNLKKGRFEFFKWDVLYGELFATKTYNRTYEVLKENTVMKIYHRPRE